MDTSKAEQTVDTSKAEQTVDTSKAKQFYVSVGVCFLQSLFVYIFLCVMYCAVLCVCVCVLCVCVCSHWLYTHVQYEYHFGGTNNTAWSGYKKIFSGGRGPSLACCYYCYCPQILYLDQMIQASMSLLCTSYSVCSLYCRCIQARAD